MWSEERLETASHWPEVVKRTKTSRKGHDVTPARFGKRNDGGASSSIGGKGEVRTGLAGARNSPEGEGIRGEMHVPIVYCTSE